MAEYSRLAKGNYTVVGGSLGVSAAPVKVINLPFKPDYVEVINWTQAITPALHGIPFAFWDASVPPILNNTPTTGLFYDTIVEEYQTATATNSLGLTTDSIKVGGGISVFSAGLGLQYGTVYAHNSVASADFAITKAAAAQITTQTAHGLSSGDVVVFSNLAQTSTTGMQQIAGIPFVVTVTSATVFTIPWDTSGSNYTVFNTSTSTNNVGSFKQLLYPALYAPNLTYISGITLGASTVIALTMPGNFVVGQEVAFRVPSIWGTTQLNSLPNVIIPGSPIYGFVTAVSASLTTPTITVNINSSAFTAFNANQPFVNYPNEKWPQVVPVGDANSGSNQINFLSPNLWNGFNNSLNHSINGPAIAGAFVNNTSQGFIIGNSVARVDTAAFFGGSDGDIIEWRAYLHDMSIP